MQDLSLIHIYAFTTLIFYNVAYNLYIFRQASRRSWRINQTAPKVEVYMFYYQDTMQPVSYTHLDVYKRQLQKQRARNKNL